MTNKKINNYTTRLEKSLPNLVRGIKFSRPQNYPEAKINITQEMALIALLMNGSSMMSDLVRETRINHTALTGVIDGLINKGLVRRDRSLGDRRVVLAELTIKGRKVANTLYLNRRECIENVISILKADEREIVISGFERLVGILSQQTK